MYYQQTWNNERDEQFVRELFNDKKTEQYEHETISMEYFSNRFPHYTIIMFQMCILVPVAYEGRQS